MKGTLLMVRPDGVFYPELWPNGVVKNLDHVAHMQEQWEKHHKTWDKKINKEMLNQ